MTISYVFVKIIHVSACQELRPDGLFFRKIIHLLKYSSSTGCLLQKTIHTTSLPLPENCNGGFLIVWPIIPHPRNGAGKWNRHCCGRNAAGGPTPTRSGGCCRKPTSLNVQYVSLYLALSPAAEGIKKRGNYSCMTSGLPRPPI